MTAREHVADVEALTAEAAAADRRASEARAAIRDQHVTESATRAARELEWRRRYLATYDGDALRQEAAEARQAVTAALADSALGQALLRLAVAERVAHSERSFAGHAALQAGLDPTPLTGSNPLIVSPQRLLTDPLALLADVVASEAERQVRAHEAARQQSLTDYGSDHGRLTVEAPLAQPILCGACSRPVPPDQVAYANGGVGFHDDPTCKPKPMFPTAASLADEEAPRLAARKAGVA